LHAFASQARVEELILAVSEPTDRLAVWWVVRIAEVKNDVSRFQKTANTFVARLSVDVLKIVLVQVERLERLTGSRGTFLKVIVEQLLPRRCVEARGVRYDAIEVEDGGIERLEVDDGRFPHGDAIAPSPLVPCW